MHNRTARGGIGWGASFALAAGVRAVRVGLSISSTRRMAAAAVPDPGAARQLVQELFGEHDQLVQLLGRVSNTADAGEAAAILVDLARAAGNSPHALRPFHGLLQQEAAQGGDGAQLGDRLLGGRSVAALACARYIAAVAAPWLRAALASPLRDLVAPPSRALLWAPATRSKRARKKPIVRSSG